MAAIPISADFGERRMRIAPDGADDLGKLIANFAKVHAVDHCARDLVAFGAVHDLFQRSRALDTCAHGKEVVFANKHNRQFVERRQVQRFVKCTLVDGAVPKKAERHPIFTAVLRGESHADRERHMRGHDGVPAIHVVLAIEIMHRSAEAARTASRLSE